MYIVDSGILDVSLITTVRQKVIRLCVHTGAMVQMAYSWSSEDVDISSDSVLHERDVDNFEQLCAAAAACLGAARDV